MTRDALTYLIERIESLRTLVSEVADAIAESMHIADDGRRGHALRLAQHLKRVKALRRHAAGTPFDALSRRFELDTMDEDILLLALSTSSQ